MIRIQNNLSSLIRLPENRQFKRCIIYIIKSSTTPEGGGGGEGTLIFSHIRRLGPFFGVQNSEFQYFWGFSEKLIFFWGMKILWIIFWGHHKIGLVWGSFLCNLGSFLRPRYRIGIFFWVAKISNIFLGCLKFLIFFGVNGRCWVRAYVCGKN